MSAANYLPAPALAGLAILAIVGLTWGYASATKPPPVCVASDASRGVTIVVVDTTDPLSPTLARRMTATIENERDKVPVGARLVVLAVNPAEASEPVELASACNPGNSTGSNPLITTGSRLDRRWRDSFVDPVNAAITRAAENPPAKSSPLLETISAVLNRPDFDGRVVLRRLVLISDMVQNDADYSQLGKGDPWKRFEKSELAKDLPLDLSGVDVAVDYLLRPEYRGIQGSKHKAFWAKLASSHGAADFHFIGQPAEPAPAASTDNQTIARR
ncbi:hypothetical protein [Mesorhizobium sp. M0589]|uniref:hypothetical protein n=1 Tax=Mesorhizobium sp. M0589 TaxID=2956965 RepID=UPI0033379188